MVARESFGSAVFDGEDVGSGAAYGNSKEQQDDIEEELQRVMDEYAGGRSTARSMDRDSVEGACSELAASTASVWDSPEHVQITINLLSSTLAAHGMPSDLALQTDRTGLDAAAACKVLHALIRQRQRDVDRQRDSQDRLARLGHDLKVRDAQREKLAQALAAKERELGALENRARLKEAAARAEGAKLRAEREEALRAVADLQRRHVQWQHEVRRKEHEYDRLQQRLRDLLTEKKREAKACLEAAGKLWAVTNQAPTRKKDDEVYKRIVSAYEAKQAEVLRESAGLRAALDHLQQEHRAVLNQQVRAGRQAAAARSGAQEALAGSLAGLGPAQAREKLAAAVAALRARAAELAAARRELPGEAACSPAEAALGAELAAERALSAEQEAVAGAALEVLQRAHEQALAATQEANEAKAAAEVARARADKMLAVARKAAGEVHAARAVAEAERTEKADYRAAKERVEAEAAEKERARAEEERALAGLEAEYAATVARLQARIAEADDQSRLEGAAAQAEAERLAREIAAERANVADALAALQAERARLAALAEAEKARLQKQAFELGAAKWEFENARKAFGDTMRMFAPGGGAGHFLANAIARRTDREAQSRNAISGGAAEAGNRAVAELSLNLVDMEADETVIDPRSLANVPPSPRLVASQS